jgi:hypothetical protein
MPAPRVYALTLEVTDYSLEAEGDDIELWIAEALEEGLPTTLVANIVSFEPLEEE